MAKRPGKRSGGVTSAVTDTETGTEGGVDLHRDLYALKVMLDRGLITQADYDARRAELMGPNDPGSE